MGLGILDMGIDHTRRIKKAYIVQTTGQLLLLLVVQMTVHKLFHVF